MTKAILLVLAGAIAASVQAAERPKPVKVKHTRMFNPLSAPKNLFEERFPSLAVKVSSVGIPRSALEPAKVAPSSRIVK